MEKQKNLYIYYDPEYDPVCTNIYINESISNQIVQFMKSKGFELLDSKSLKEIMLSVIKSENKNIVIVFAQDVSPDTVLNDPSPSALIRQYLDNGGSVVWIGDIPFFYQAKENEKNRNDDWWKTGAAGNVLGVNPVWARPPLKGTISKIGKRMGLTVSWTGIRPVIKSKEIIVLLEAKSNVSTSYFFVRPNWFERLSNRFRGINISAGNVAFGLTLADLENKEENILLTKGNILWNKKLAHAWFKNFDSKNPNSGFYRIWDYIPSVITNEQLDDLHRIAIYSINK